MVKFGRVQQQSTKSGHRAKQKSFPAPTAGWVRNQSFSDPKRLNLGAEVLDNGFPTQEGVRMRRGQQMWATAGAADMTAFLAYPHAINGHLFAADATSIYDITTPADPLAAIVPTLTGFTSGDWSSTAFSAGGADYLIAVNGADSMRQFNGTVWSIITAAIVGVATSALWHVFQWKKQLVFLEKNALRAWILPALQVTGTPVQVDLSSLFSLGGYLATGFSWSTDDTGQSPDDRLVFVTSEGEIAVFIGTDPSSSATFGLSGLYKIGRPLGKKATIRVGGNVFVATDDGVIPIAAVITVDELALKVQSVTYPIEEAWRDIIRNYGFDLPFSMALWPSENMLIIGVPQTALSQQFALVANARSGAFGRYLNHDIRDVIIWDNKFLFCTAAGEIRRGEETGLDIATPYSMTIVPRFSDFGSGNQKTVMQSRLLARTNREAIPQLTTCLDWDVTTPTAPSGPAQDADADVWDDGIWDLSVWGSTPYGPKAGFSEWQSTPGSGVGISPATQLTSARTASPDIEIIRVDVLYEMGDQPIA